MDYDDLPVTQRVLAATASRSGLVVVLASLATAAIAWTWLVLVAMGAGAADPGSATAVQNGWWLPIDPPAWLPSGVVDALVALCAPVAAKDATATFVASLAMWSAMSVAMMMPSAAPMLRTYADIAHTAAGRGMRVCSVWTIAAGYLVVWLGFSLAAAFAQTVLVGANVVPNLDAPVAIGGAGGLLLLAGLYQFSSLKEACLEKCRNPFATLFGRWSDRSADIFRLGIRQGLFCLGCCWALMLVMFAVGTMNLAWMAVLALFTLLEKTGTGKVTTRLVGVILAGWGGALVALALAS